MTTTALITVDGEDDALALREWLDREDDFRGRVRLHDQGGAAGTMGPVLDTVSVVVSGGGLTALTTALVAYLRTRGMKVKITAKVGARSVTLEGERLHKAGLRELNEAAVAVAKELGAGDAPR